MSKREITSITTADGTEHPIDAYPCDRCGQPGGLYMAVTRQAIWAFCSWECRQEAIRVDGQPLTLELMRAAGLRFVSPRPEA